MKTIVLQKYSEEWPILFESEKERLMSVLGNTQIEHIGSTSVPHLSAKPVIDMMASVKDLYGVEEIIKALAKFGYTYIPEIETQTPDRKFLKKKTESGPWYHLSLTERDSVYWKEHLLFRNYLRSHPETLREYENLKRQLVKKYISDFDKYNADKTDFIRKVIKKAEAKGIDT